MHKISILLSTYNGAKHLKEQLDSLYAQTYSNIEIAARDDGSSDNTIEILKSYDVKLLMAKENLGAKGSFAELLSYAVTNSESDYFMFCDQDDIWKNNKVEKTFAKMQEMEEEFDNIPLLVHTDLEVVDEHLHTISPSMWAYEYINPSKNSLNHLLVHNTITGCAMMINRKLAELSLPISSNSIMHDWWIGLVASSFGKIGYIDETTIKYRQHGLNDTGAKKYSYLSIMQKVYNLLFGNELDIRLLRKNIKQSKAFLEIYNAILNDEVKLMLENFSNIESKSFIEKRKIIVKYKLFKYGIIRNIGLLLRV